MGRPMLPLVSQVCEECGETFQRKNYQRTRRFCSHHCAAIVNTPFRNHTGSRNVNYNGGFSQSQGRTVIVTRDGSVMLYARALMICHLQHDLGRDEVVHHINHDPTDDRVENLEVMTRAEHARHHHGKSRAPSLQLSLV